MKKFLLFLAMGFFAYAIQTGEVPPKVLLKGEHGGKHDGKVWSSQMLIGKVHTVLYMDPEEREEAMPFLNELNNQNFDKKSYETIAIVNLGATWMPSNFGSDVE